MTGDGLPVEDLDLRYGYKHEREEECCELIHYFPRASQNEVYIHDGNMRTLMNVAAYGEEIHHIFSQRERWDRTWNLVYICKRVHQWCERYKNPGRVLAIYHKLKVGEWDEDNAHACLGFWPLGWVHGNKPDTEDQAVAWVVPYWEHITKQKGVA